MTSTSAVARAVDRISARRTTAIGLAWFLAVVLLVSLPWLGMGDYWVRQIQLIGILALIVSGLNLSFGFAGELALGQAAAYAAGAYAAGYLAVNIVNDVLLGVLVGAVAALVVGLVSGAPGLRLGGWVLAIASFFLVLLIPDLVQIFPESVLGGTLGLRSIPLPSLLGTELDTHTFYVLVVVTTAVWFALFRNLAVSRYGRAFLVLRESTTLAASLGVSPYRMKVTAYTLGSVPAGMAGALFAYLDGYVSPASFTLNLTIAVLAASILGGSASVYGVFVGAALLQLGPLQSTEFQQYSLLVYGVFLVVGGLVLGGGVAALARRIGRAARARFVPHGRPSAADDPVGAAARELPRLPGRPLTITSVSKRFGGVTAIDDVSFDAQPGQVTALIGPNGSGKTTMLNLISGLYPGDAGHISLGHDRLTGRSADRIARLGVARTFQTPVVPEGLSVRQVAESSRFALDRVTVPEVMLRLPRFRRACESDEQAAQDSLAALGIADRADADAGSLALGTRRLLELARAVAARPSLVLLDEIASGLDQEELDELSAVIVRLREAGATVVLVEHNFALVRSLADKIVVLAEGRLIAAGSPADIELHPEVINQYLGDTAGSSATTAASKDGAV